MNTIMRLQQGGVALEVRLNALCYRFLANQSRGLSFFQSLVRVYACMYVAHEETDTIAATNTVLENIAIRSYRTRHAAYHTARTVYTDNSPPPPPPPPAGVARQRVGPVGVESACVAF